MAVNGSTGTERQMDLFKSTSTSYQYLKARHQVEIAERVKYNSFHEDQHSVLSPLEVEKQGALRTIPETEIGGTPHQRQRRIVNASTGQRKREGCPVTSCQKLSLNRSANDAKCPGNQSVVPYFGRQQYQWEPSEGPLIHSSSNKLENSMEFQGSASRAPVLSVR